MKRTASKAGGAGGRRKRQPRIRRLLFRSAIGALCAAILWCGYVMWHIYGYSLKEPLPRSDAAIVLGAALWRNEPSPALKERLDYALKLYEDGTVDKLILSGGLGGLASDITEAEGMKRYLVERGVPEDKLLLETEAADTFQNVYFSKKIAERDGLSSFILVTHDYHAARSLEIAQFMELGHVKAAGVDSRVLNAFYNESREFLAYSKWKLEELLLRLKLRPVSSML